MKADIQNEKVSWTGRMDAATKEELKSLIDASGETPGEFVGQLISAYKLNKVLDVVPTAREDVRSLHACIMSVESIYTALLMRMEADREAIIQQSRLAIMEAEKDAKAVRAQCEDQIKLFRGDLEKMTKRYEAADRLMVTANADKEDMAEKLKAANDALNATKELLEQYRTKPSTDDLQKELEQARAKIRALEAAEDRHKAAMDKIGIDHSRALLAATEAHQEAIAAMQKEYADAIKAMGPLAKKSAPKK